MINKHLRHLVLSGLAILVLTITACTRHATTPPATADQTGDDALSSQRATMEAVQQMLQTQTAQAIEAQPEPDETQIPPTTIPTQDIFPTSAIVVTPQSTQPSPTAATPTPAYTEYTVKRGDWVYSIARKFDVDPDDIIALNRLSAPYVVVPGQVLKIPTTASGTPSPSGTPVPGGTTHTVRAGEWVYSIARKYGVTPEAIIQANGLRYPYYIYPGMELTIP